MGPGQGAARGLKCETRRFPLSCWQARLGRSHGRAGWGEGGARNEVLSSSIIGSVSDDSGSAGRIMCLQSWFCTTSCTEITSSSDRLETKVGYKQDAQFNALRKRGRSKAASRHGADFSCPLFVVLFLDFLLSALRTMDESLMMNSILERSNTFS